jgi:hypothetical protein
LDDLHHRDDGKSQAACRFTVRNRVADDVLINGFEDFGIDVGVGRDPQKLKNDQ